MEPINLSDFEPLARQYMSAQAFDYVAGGAEDERTLAANSRAFDHYALRPRVLSDVSVVNTATTVLGTDLAFPVLVAPVALQVMVHPDGESAVARAAAEAGTAMVVSTLASTRLENVATVAEGPKWFQLYCYRDRAVTEHLVRRAEAAGYRAICLTVDVPRIGRRERDIRNRFTIPPEAVPRNFEEVADLTALDADQYASQLHAYVAGLLDSSLTWDSVDWLRHLTDLPILLKGIMTGEDTRLAREHGVDGVVVSNHGGRQLDGALATVDALADVVAAAEGAIPVLMDGGIRRGTDVVKALALGAAAVLIGRPCMWGLGAAGELGVVRVLELLRQEVELALALSGCPSVAAVTPEHVVRQITASPLPDTR